MGQITSSIGLVSGINTGQIIDQLIGIEQQPVNLLQTRITAANAQKAAYTDLQTKLQAMQTAGTTLERPTTFAAAKATSSDENVLTATAAVGASLGTFQFQVSRLVTAQQSITKGFAGPNALVGAGTLTLSLGGGNLSTPTPLSVLNGGTGVQRGQFRITDRSGKSSVIDISSAITLDDVVKKINNALDINVKASIKGNGLVIQDDSGATTSALSIADLSGGSAAKDLGIAGAAAGGTPGQITGTSINTVSASTALSTLNDGRGVRTASGATDFRITLSDNSQLDINLSSAQTLGDVVQTINSAGRTKLKAAIDPATNAITLTDTAGGASPLSIQAQNGSSAAADLGLTPTSVAGVIHGNGLLSGLDTVLLSSLNGGHGLTLGQIAITSRSGGAPVTVDLGTAKTVQDVLDTINNASAGVTASLNAAGNGIGLKDSSGGTGNLIVANADGTNTATTLGLAGSFDTGTAVDNGKDLHVQYVSENTLLSNYNGGKGVTPAAFTITNSAGAVATVKLDQGTFNTLGDVIAAINAKRIGVTASINATGNGLLLTDSAGGGQKLTVKDTTGTTAGDLNIAGTAAATTIDGGLQKSIEVTSADTLTTVQKKIQDLGFGVVANIVNDGSGTNGYHLAITSLNSGSAGRVVIDAGSTNLQTQNLVQGRDAAVFIGGSDSTQPLLVTSHTNQLTGIIPGVTVSLVGASSTPVTLNVTPDSSGVTTQVQNFTTGFNAVVDEIKQLTTFNSTTNQGGLLLGDATTRQIQAKIYTVFSSAVSGAGQYRTLGDLGITLGDGAKITFNADKFNAAYAADPTAVKNLFTQAQTGLGAIIDKSMTALVDPVSGVITRENQTIDTRVQQFQGRITQLDAIIADKRKRLEQQFANMESVLANLQSQQAALGTLSSSTGTKSTSSSGSTSSGSSSGSSSSSDTSSGSSNTSSSSTGTTSPSSSSSTSTSKTG